MDLLHIHDFPIDVVLILKSISEPLKLAVVLNTFIPTSVWQYSCLFTYLYNFFDALFNHVFIN